MRKRLLAVMAALLLLFSSVPALANPTPTPVPTLPPFDVTVPVYNPADPASLTPEQIYAQAFILINREDGRILMEKNADMRMNPASTTKVMTLLLAMEYGEMNEIVKIPEEAADIPNDSSVVPVHVGEEMLFIDLLYGMMLRSGNDAANAVAVLIAGSVDSFVEMMNQRAQELGCTGTHFSNPHGYTSDDHYTTVRDMAIISREAMKNPTVRKIVDASQYMMGQTNMRGEMTIQNSNMLVSVGSEYQYSGANGVKTGTTSAAGQCLISSASRNDVDLLCVAFKSTTVFTHAKWQDAARLLDYGFSQYRYYSFDDLYAMLNITVPISGAAENDASGGIIKLNALVNRAGSYEQQINVNDLNALVEDFKNRLQFEYTHALEAPIEVGTVMGRLTFTPDEGDVITAVLVSDRDVAAVPSISNGGLSHLFDRIPSWMHWVLRLLAVFLVLLIIIRIIMKIRRARRRALARKRARERARRRAAQLRAEQLKARQRPRYY